MNLDESLFEELDIQATTNKADASVEEASETRESIIDKAMKENEKNTGIKADELKKGFTGYTGKKVYTADMKKLHLDESLFESHEDYGDFSNERFYVYPIFEYACGWPKGTRPAPIYYTDNEDEAIRFMDDYYSDDPNEIGVEVIDTYTDEVIGNKDIEHEDEECDEMEGHEDLVDESLLTERNWRYELEHGPFLREAINEFEPTEDSVDNVLAMLQSCYQELRDNGFIDDDDCEEWCDELDRVEYDDIVEDYESDSEYFADEFDIEDSDDYVRYVIDSYMEDFYDLYDNISVFIPTIELKESLNGTKVNDFRSAVYNALAEVGFEFTPYGVKEAGPDESDFNSAIEWFMDKYFEGTPIEESLSEDTLDDFEHELYRSVAKVCYRYINKGLTKNEVDKVLDLVAYHLDNDDELCFNESYNLTESLIDDIEDDIDRASSKEDIIAVRQKIKSNFKNLGDREDKKEIYSFLEDKIKELGLYEDKELIDQEDKILKGLLPLYGDGGKDTAAEKDLWSKVYEELEANKCKDILPYEHDYDALEVRDNFDKAIAVANNHNLTYKQEPDKVVIFIPKDKIAFVSNMADMPGKAKDATAKMGQTFGEGYSINESLLDETNDRHRTREKLRKQSNQPKSQEDYDKEFAMQQRAKQNYYNSEQYKQDQQAKKDREKREAEQKAAEDAGFSSIKAKERKDRASKAMKKLGGLGNSIKNGLNKNLNIR